MYSEHGIISSGPFRTVEDIGPMRVSVIRKLIQSNPKSKADLLPGLILYKLHRWSELNPVNEHTHFLFCLTYYYHLYYHLHYFPNCDSAWATTNITPWPKVQEPSKILILLMSDYL